MVLRIVDLPLPLGPSSPTNCPSPTAMLMSLTMRRPVMSTDTPSSRRLTVLPSLGRPVPVGPPPDEEQQRRRADERGDDTHRHLLRGDDGPDQQVADDHERGAEQHPH